MDTTIPEAITQYFPYIAKAGVPFVIAFLSTPIIGKIAKALKVVDLPKEKRKFNDRTRDRRIHKGIIPKLGGVSILIAFFVSIGIFDNVPTEVIPIFLGMLILGIMGVLDDKFDLSGKYQILIQIIVVLIVVISGITITEIQIAGQNIDFSLFSQKLDFGLFDYNFIFPADLITFGWIMLVMNALAWVCGIDALGESITFVASVTFAALSIKFGNPQYTLILFLFAGAIYGFIPYNFPKAKIFAGTSGHINYGFFLASMSIISGTKLPSSIIILSIPILDMAWVLINRIRHNHISSPIDLLSISDRTHLHHRIMDLGFTAKETLRIELAIFAIFCVIGFYFGGFSTDFVVLMAVIVAIIILFTLIGTLYSLNWRKKTQAQKHKPQKTIDKEVTPEQRYAY